MTEQWKTIEGYEGLYEISNTGQVKSLPSIVWYDNSQGHRKRTKQGGILTPKLEKSGYYRIGLRKNGAKKFFAIHRLVATAFVPNPDNLPEVNHKDENKLNNRADNLEWCTTQYNSSYGTRWQRLYKNGGGSRHLRIGKYDQEGNLLGTWDSIAQAARANGVSESAVRMCAKGKPSAGRVFGYIYKFMDDAAKTAQKVDYNPAQTTAEPSDSDEPTVTPADIHPLPDVLVVNGTRYRKDEK